MRLNFNIIIKKKDFLKQKDLSITKEPLKMKTPRLRRYAIAAGVLLLVAVCLYAQPKLFPRYMDASANGGQMASFLSIIHYNGLVYIHSSKIKTIACTPGDVLGTVKFNSCYYTGPYYVYEISSTLLKAGDSIYEWKGNSSDFRICGIKSDGTIHGFERYAINNPFDITFAERFSHAVDKMGESIVECFETADEPGYESITE